jgi:hypothetical protein
MKYKVIRQSHHNDREFVLEDELGERLNVDFFSGGAFDHPEGVDATAESWRAWLETFVGKTLEIEHLAPYSYITSGEQFIVDDLNPKE